MSDKPPPSDPHWEHHADHRADDRHVHQEWRLLDEDGTGHTHVEEWVNRRARTDRPPT